MSKFVTHIFGLVLLLVMAIGISSCEDNPVRPRPVERPDCWKPLVNIDEVPGFAEDAPAWSNDGQFVAYFSAYDTCNDFAWNITITDLNGLTKRQLPIIGTHMRWLPGDSELVISTGFAGGPLVIYNLNSGDVEELGVVTRDPPFDISPSGNIVYFGGVPSTPDSVSVLYRLNLDTKESLALAIGGAPSASPDGKFILFDYGHSFLFDLEEFSISSFVTAGGAGPDWTPDSKSVVSYDGFGRVFVTDLDGNSTFLIGETGTPFGAFGPVHVSPDGKTILFDNYTPEDDFYHVWRMDIDGKNARKFLAW